MHGNPLAYLYASYRGCSPLRRLCERRALVDSSTRLRAGRTRTRSLKQHNWPPAHGVFVMTKLARPITKDEVAAYNLAGVVLLRGILDLPTVNTLRRCIDEAVRTLQDSPSGYDLSLLTRAIENYDRNTLAASSEGQHDVAAIADHILSTGKPFLFDSDKSGKGSFL